MTVLRSPLRSVLRSPLYSPLASKWGSEYEAEAEALFARFTTPATGARKALINDAIKAFKDGGLWSKFDWLYMMAAETSQAARLNWVSSTYAASLTARNSPAFTADRGYKGDGSAADLTVDATGPTNFSLNAGTISVGVQLYGGATNALLLLWHTSRFSINVAGTFYQGRINDGTSASLVAPGKARLALTRTGASARSWRIDGAGGGSDTVAATSLSATTLYLLSAGTTAYSSDRLSYAYAGAFSVDEMVAVDGIIATYLTAVGAI